MRVRVTIRQPSAQLSLEVETSLEVSSLRAMIIAVVALVRPSRVAAVRGCVPAMRSTREHARSVAGYVDGNDDPRAQPSSHFPSVVRAVEAVIDTTELEKPPSEHGYLGPDAAER